MSIVFSVCRCYHFDWVEQHTGAACNRWWGTSLQQPAAVRSLVIHEAIPEVNDQINIKVAFTAQMQLFVRCYLLVMVVVVAN